jgi:long-chain acyl-CoA synthetase
VPTHFVAMINYPDLKKYNLRSLRICVTGAAPLPVAVQKKFQEVTGCRLLEGYGLAEAAPVTHNNPIYGKSKIGSIGIPVSATLARIVDIEDPDQDLPVGQVGQLAVKGPQVMLGYLNRPEETAQVLRNGWLLTGDIARMDEDGYFYILDRKKEIIIAGGINIYPREVEEVLCTHPKIKEAAVIGLPDLYRGEKVKAYVVLKEGETISEPEVIAYCARQLARYKVPESVEIRPALPKSLVGKVVRRLLVEEEMEKLK